MWIKDPDPDTDPQHCFLVLGILLEGSSIALYIKKVSFTDAECFCPAEKVSGRGYSNVVFHLYQAEDTAMSGSTCIQISQTSRNKITSKLLNFWYRPIGDLKFSKLL